MSRKLLFLPLLLATAVALADDPPETPPKAEKPAVAAQAAPEQAPATPAKADEGPPADPDAGATSAPDGETKDGAEGTQPTKETGPKVVSGMSILGNQEAPKSLVIVPWKSSEIGDSVGVSTMLDDSRQPVDRDVFLRALGYYEIRSGATP